MFELLVILLFGSTSAQICPSGCGTNGYCLEANGVGCDFCACPANVTGKCCESGYTCPDYALNFYYDSSVIYDTNFVVYYGGNYGTLPPTSACGNGNRICLNTTTDNKWGNSLPDESMLGIYCPNVCIKDTNGDFWFNTDPNYQGFRFSPYCNGTSCEFYVWQAFSSLTYIATSSDNNNCNLNNVGLKRVRDGFFKPIMDPVTQCDNTKAMIIPKNGTYQYVTAVAVSCNGCNFDTEGCDSLNSTSSTCAGVTCLHGGTCMTEPCGFVAPCGYCQCPNIWNSTYVNNIGCDEFDPCAYFQNNPNYTCLNGGTCYTTPALFPYSGCNCTLGYCGSRCEQTGINCIVTTTSTTTTSTTTTSTTTTSTTTPAPCLSCIWPKNIRDELKEAIIEPNFNRDFLPFILANTPTIEKSRMSWNVEDLYIWAAYERTELSIFKNLTKWYENSMGNCFTFNHENSSKISKLRYSGEFGSFKAQMKIRQEEYLDWVYTASLLLFLHRKEETIMGESVSYQMAPGEEVTFTVRRNDFTRMGPPYGRCIKDKKEVKSYYNPGSGYTVDSCFRSCYQDYVQEKCGCMDPRYFTPLNAWECDLFKRTCVENVTIERGEPSKWPECSCPPSCKEYMFDVSWTKTVFRNFPACNSSSNITTNSTNNCMQNFLDGTAIFSVFTPTLIHKVFAEKPKKTLNDIITSLCNITGLLLGLSVISIFEILFLIIRIFYVLITNNSAVHEVENEGEDDEKR